MFEKLKLSNLRGNHGGVKTRILMAVVTLIAVGFFIVILLSKKGESQRFNYDNALTIAEYGLTEALLKLHESPQWREGFRDQIYKEGSFTVTLDQKQSGDTTILTIESVGKSGLAKRSKSIVLQQEVSAQGEITWKSMPAR